MSPTVQDGIIIGAVGGFLAGLTVWFAQLIKEYAMTKWHKRRIYNWLHNRYQFKEGVGTTADIRSRIDSPWVTTIEIAYHTNLPQDRVRYICSIHKKIRPLTERDLFPNEPLTERWALREFVLKFS